MIVPENADITMILCVGRVHHQACGGCLVSPKKSPGKCRGFSSNTTWNLRVLINGGAYADEKVTVLGVDEGPMARIVGLHGNRTFALDYRPAPYVEMLNVPLSAVPSLYDYQLRKRLSDN